MFKIRHIPALILLLLIIATSVPAQRGPDYFPLRVGNFWKYRHTEGSEITFKILTDEKQADGTTLYLMEKLAGVKVHSWYGRANGFLILRKDAYPEHQGLEVTYDPPKQILKNVLRPGATWEWRGKSVAQNDASESSKVVGPETVKVIAGTFRAMKVVSVVTDGGAPKTVTSWYAPGVGLVKSWTEAGAIKYGWELIEYKFKK